MINETIGKKMKNYRTVFLPLATAVLSISVLSARQSNAQDSSPAGNNAPQADNSCYVHLFDDDNFDEGDDNDIIYGPGKWGNLENLPDATETDWGGDADSLKVGPTATVNVWENENFQGRNQTFAPSTQKPKLDLEFKSMEITCQ